jgi:DNA polymerase III alpha subunit
MRIVHKLPTPVDVQDGKVPDSLRHLAEEGLGRKYPGAVPEPVKEQLAWELQWITRTGRVGQHLMLRDILMKAKDLGIPVSPGFGRVGNSVFAYALGLCEPDPYAYGLVIAESSHIFLGGFGINVSADRAHELITYVKAAYAVEDSIRTLDLIELPALDLMQAVLERACAPSDHGFWSSVPLDDPETYKLLGAGDTDGVYQLDTDDAKKYLREWRPATFTDLLVLTTVNRYGTEALIPEIIARAHGKGTAPYSDPLLATVTAESYGFLIWQEQVIGALTALAGFDGDSADRVRRILCKRMAGPVVEAQDRFISACVSRMNVPEDRAHAVWFELDINSAKARSKAHAVAHGLLTYRMAYLKAHWRKAFDAALLAGK